MPELSLGAQRLELAQRRQQVTMTYDAHGAKPRIKARLLVEYTCRNKKKCLLLHCWPSPLGLLYYVPPYKNSPERNDAESVQSARVKLTTDAEGRRWPSRGGVLSDAEALQLQCDHVRLVRTAAEIVSDAAAGTAGVAPTRHTF